MAPVLNILVQWLPSTTSLSSTLKSPIQTKSITISPTFEGTAQQQQPIGLQHIDHGQMHTMDTSSRNDISTVSWGKNRLDIFGLADNNLTHKFWDGGTWLPADFKLETLGNGLATAPVAVTWGPDRLDVFGLDDHNVIKHQYWDGSSWKPNVARFENLGGQCDPDYTIAANTWGPDRLDIFCRGLHGDLLHQYYDGTQWQPEAGSLESLGGDLKSGPSVVSWGEDRLDIFAVDAKAQVVHIYWDGMQWSKWESLSSGPDLGFSFQPLTVTSWGENRLDLFAVELDKSLWHLYWDGSHWAEWEHLGTVLDLLDGSVAATSWSENRLDIVALAGPDKHYHYKYYDGEAWRPDATGWYDKSPGHKFATKPSVVSWGENRLDIFGESTDHEWLHQAWAGIAWYPGTTDWELLGWDFSNGPPLESGSSVNGRMPVKTELRH